MIWSLIQEQKLKSRVEFALLDGDMRAVELEDMSLDIGMAPLTKAHYFQSGRRVKIDSLPSRARYGDHSQPLADYKEIMLAQLCSGAFRDVIEALEPGRHQFEPLEIENSATSSDKRPYFWFFPNTRLRALDPDRTLPPLSESGFFRWRHASPGKWRFVFRKEVVADHDLFCSMEVTTHIFVTDRLKRACEEAGLFGLRFSGPYEITE